MNEGRYSAAGNLRPDAFFFMHLKFKHKKAKYRGEFRILDRERGGKGGGTPNLVISPMVNSPPSFLGFRSDRRGGDHVSILRPLFLGFEED